MPDGSLAWERDGREWPNRDASRFVRASGLRWHVQCMGSGPTVLLVHGTGAATHSWRGLAPLLARRFTVVAPDLPGHGFTDPLPAHRLSLPGMARALRDVLRALGTAADPALTVGHSAGAAILARMCLDGDVAPRALVGLNAALLPPPGNLGEALQPLARLVAGLPLLPQVFAWRARDRAVVDGLLRNTGSTLDPAGAALYRRLARNPRQVAGALGMMAGWDLRPLARDLPRLKPPLALVVGTNDGMVPPSEAQRVRALLPSATVAAMPGLGHLAHEERPADVAAILEGVARTRGALPMEDAA